MHRAGITTGRVILELNGVRLACGNLFRTDNRARASHVVVGMAHLVAVKVGCLHGCRPLVVVGGGRGVAVGVFYVCDEHVEHVVVSVVVAHALPLMVLGLGEARQVAVGIVGHVVDRRLCPVVHRDAGDVAMSVDLRGAFAVNLSSPVLYGDVLGHGDDVLRLQVVVGNVGIQLVVRCRFLVRGEVAVSVVSVVHGGAHAALSCVVVNGLPYGGECGEEHRRVCLLFKFVGVLRALQFVACCIVERLGSDEVVHVQVAVVSVFCHLRAVNGIAVLRVYLLGDDLLKTIEVAFAAVAVAAFVFKLVAHPGGPVLGIAARGLHAFEHIARAGHGKAGTGFLIGQGDMSAERQSNAFKQIGACGEISAYFQFIRAIFTDVIGIAVTVYVYEGR